MDTSKGTKELPMTTREESPIVYQDATQTNHVAVIP